MGVMWLWVAVMLIVVGAQADRGGSSLRGALEALQRRQRGRMHPPLLPQPDYDALYEFVPPQGYPGKDVIYPLQQPRRRLFGFIAYNPCSIFVKPEQESDYPVDVEDIEDEPNPKYVVKFLDESERPPEEYEYKVIKKKNTRFNEPTPNNQESPFRERAHHSNNDKLRDLFMDKTEVQDKRESPVTEKDAEYALLLGQLWSKYKYNKDHSNNVESAPQGVVKLYKEKVVKKRYPESWGPIAFKRKRSSDSDADRPILADYIERKHEGGQSDPNYNGYELNDDDKDDLREEYAIAFQPLDDDTLSDLADDDQYTYDTVEKRFPVTKRSSGPYDFGSNKRLQNQNKRETVKAYRSSSGTDPRILKDLSKIFGDSGIEIIKNPVKRSSDHEEGHHEVKPPMLPMADHSNQTQESNITMVQEDNSHEHHGHNIHHPGVSGQEVEHEHEHKKAHDHDKKQDHQGDSDHKNYEKGSEKPIILRKKSIDWSDYFGIDKRKSFGNSDQDRLRKQYFDTFNKEVIYPLNSFRRHSYAKRNFVKPKPDQNDMQIARAEALTSQDNKRDLADDNDSKLDNIDKKLKTMEGFIVDEALHFSNAGEELDSKEEQEMKEKLLSRLAAAYSLEKMRKALKEFKQSLQTPKSEANSDVSQVPTDDAKAKRVAVKKELLNNDIPMANKMQEKSDDFEDEQGAGHYLNGKVEEQFSEGYMGGSGRHRVPIVSTASAAGACPVLAKIVQRCRGVELLAGDRGQLFLPLCSLHQICYLCGEAPPTTCDLVFLSEADTTCDGDMSCQRAARSALMALRELHDNLADELDGECEASPCLPATLKLNVGWQRALQR